jgi:hypothetical protein
MRQTSRKVERERSIGKALVTPAQGRAVAQHFLGLWVGGAGLVDAARRSSCVVTMFSISELSFASCGGIALMRIAWSE